MPRVDIPPKRDEVLSPRTGLISERWLRWMAALLAAVTAAPQRVGPSVTLDAQSGAVSGTVPAPPLAAGVYRVSVGVTEDAAIVIAFGTETRSAAATSSASWLVRLEDGASVAYTITAAGPWDAAIVVEQVEV